MLHFCDLPSAPYNEPIIGFVIMIDDKLLNVERRASRLWEEGKFKPAFRLYRQLASQGYDCYLNLGVMYSNGEGVKQSDRWALYWYHKVLAKNPSDSSAANNIGIVYRDQGNKALALSWFKKAVELGDGDASLQLAFLYLRKPVLDLTLASRYLLAAIHATYVTEGSRESAARLLDWLNKPPHQPVTRCRPFGSRRHCQQARQSILRKYHSQRLSGSPLPPGERG